MFNCLHFNLKYFHTVGWPFFEKIKFTSFATEKCFWILFTICDITHVINMVTVTIAAVLATDDLAKFCATSVAVLYNGGYYIRFILYRVRKDKVERLYNSLNAICNECHKRDGTYKDFITNGTRMMRNVSLARLIFELTVTVMCCTLFAIQSFFGSTLLPANAWYPFDQDTVWGTFSVCAIQWVAFFSAVARVSASDSFLAMVIMLVAVHMRYLKGCLPQGFPSDSENVRISSYEQLRWWVQQHDETLKSIRLFQEIISPFLAGTYITVLAFVLFWGVIIVSGANWNLNHKINLLGVGLINLTQLYITCVAADHLQEMESSIADDAYNLTMILSSKKQKVGYSIIKAKTQKRTLLSAYGFHPLSSSTFAVLVQATFSYYLAIIQINQHDKSQESN